MEIISFIFGSAVVATVAVSVAKWLIKKLTKKETKTTGALIILFVFSLILATLEYGFTLLTSETQLIIAGIYGTGIALYDTFKKVIWDEVVIRYLR